MTTEVLPATTVPSPALCDMKAFGRLGSILETAPYLIVGSA